MACCAEEIIVFDLLANVAIRPEDSCGLIVCFRTNNCKRQSLCVNEPVSLESNLWAMQSSPVFYRISTKTVYGILAPCPVFYRIRDESCWRKPGSEARILPNQLRRPFTEAWAPNPVLHWIRYEERWLKPGPQFGIFIIVACLSERKKFF